jgi:hypothetical protein
MLLMLVLAWWGLIAERAGLVFVAVAGAGTILAVWQAAAVWRNGGVRETLDGITNRRMVRHLHWRWEEIDEFTHVGPRVYLVTRDRRTWPLIGVAQGWRIVWKGGESRDIVGVLNRDLAQARVPAKVSSTAGSRPRQV